VDYNKNSSRLWEEHYADGDVVLVPYNDIFSSIFSYYGKDNLGKLKILEIGCGTGNNLLFAGLHLGMEIAGIDVSKTAVDYTNNLLNSFGIQAEIKVGDAENLPFDDGSYDIVCDRAAMQHCTYEKIKKIVNEVHRVMKDSSLYVLHIATERHPLYSRGDLILSGGVYNPDEFGVRSFLSKQQISQLFSQFKILKYEEQERVDQISNKIVGSIYSIAAIKCNDI